MSTSPRTYSRKSSNVSPHHQHIKHHTSNQKATAHKTTKHIKLVEDAFGYVVDDAGKRQNIRRFTWTNHNCIRAQVITYGARVTSLCLPNRKGVVEDVVLGFDDVEGYLYYDNLYMGATIGRVADKIENATFALDNKQYWVSANNGKDHFNGGLQGLDKVVWSSYVDEYKVMLSYVSRDGDEGYPGDLFVRITFELTPKNEFVIDMSAVTTKPTIVNLSNLLYFNLGGHWAGPDEIDRHIVSVNANCHLIMKDNGLPKGTIMNVIYTKSDFQCPKLLKNDMHINNGFDEHLCVNRAVDQGVCFVARALHPPSGRILEMYSNQYGVRFSTANNFELGLVDIIPTRISLIETRKSEDKVDEVFKIIEKLHAQVAETLSIDSKTNYLELKDLIRKMYDRRLRLKSKQTEEDSSLQEENKMEEDLILNPLQARYLEEMVNATTTAKLDSKESYTELKTVIESILETAIAKVDLEMHNINEDDVKSVREQEEEVPKRELSDMKAKSDAELKRKGTIRLENNIPSFYKDGRIHGKNNAIYKKHGAMCFQSENYPNAIYHKNFPNCKLRPGETYRHTIVYKYWIQTGDPSKWVRRN